MAWRGELAGVPAVVVDVETTGLDPGLDRIVEIALVTRDGVLLDTRVRPSPARHFSGPHGLGADDVAHSPCFGTIAEDVHSALRGRMLVAHVAAFDIAFLRAEFGRLGRPLPSLPYICTIALAELLDLGHARRRLSYACARHGVALPRPHTARDDARAAADLFARYGEIAGSRGLGLDELAARGSEHACVQSWRLAPLRSD